MSYGVVVSSAQLVDSLQCAMFPCLWLCIVLSPCLDGVFSRLGIFICCYSKAGCDAKLSTYRSVLPWLFGRALWLCLDSVFPPWDILPTAVARRGVMLNFPHAIVLSRKFSLVSHFCYAALT